MHPAPSVILFTVLSGLGFGMLAFLGLGLPAPTGWIGFVFYAIAFALTVGGLVASTFHLANPKNAPKAFSQWRSSWLSREAVLAVAACLVMGLHAALSVLFGVVIAPLGWLGAALCLATVYATAMIYTQLKAVPRWHQPMTPVVFLVMSLAGGSLLTGQIWAAYFLLPLAAIVVEIFWRIGDRRFQEAGTTMETATGLGAIGKVSLFEPPHTGDNYLLKEMVYVVGRKHAFRLRAIATFGIAILPFLLLLISDSHLVAGLAVLLHLTGALAARWLFFAEAEHVVGLYYGKR
ncbi:MAG: DmsC/YnfH family molybdoenzyme membrane anchor subunit [Pseudomonadota bacterium]